MGSIKSRLDEKGRAFIDVIITPSTLYREAVGIDKFKGTGRSLLGIGTEFRYKAKALIDTGASCTSIDLTVAKKLNLITKGKVPVHSPRGNHDYDAYDIDIFLGMENRLNLLQNRIVIASDIQAQGIHMLIGTDIIKLGILTFNKGRDFSFSL